LLKVGSSRSGSETERSCLARESRQRFSKIFQKTRLLNCTEEKESRLAPGERRTEGLPKGPIQGDPAGLTRQKKRGEVKEQTGTVENRKYLVVKKSRELQIQAPWQFRAVLN